MGLFWWSWVDVTLPFVCTRARCLVFIFAHTAVMDQKIEFFKLGGIQSDFTRLTSFISRVLFLLETCGVE